MSIRRSNKARKAHKEWGGGRRLPLCWKLPWASRAGGLASDRRTTRREDAMGDWGEAQERVCICGRGRGVGEGAIDGGRGGKGQVRGSKDVPLKAL